MRLYGVNIQQTSFDCGDVIVLQLDMPTISCSRNSSCEVIDLSANTSSRSQKLCEVVDLSNNSSTSQKSSQVVNLSNISLAKQKAKTKKHKAKTKKQKAKTKKQKHIKPERKISLHEEESPCQFAGQTRSNLKCIINGKCKQKNYKCQEKLSEHNNNHSKSGKPSESEKGNEFSKISLHVPEHFRRDRILPHCFRCKCITTGKAAERRSCRTTSTERQPKSKGDGKPKHKHSKKHRHHKHLCRKKQRKPMPTKEETGIGELSPISKSPLPESITSILDISYEDISMDSFSTQSEEELDTLIKRTKERERSMVYGEFCLPSTVDHRPYQTSTPYAHCLDSEDVSTVFTGDMDVSVHSLSTVVLTPHVRTEVYSPTDSLNYEYRKHSPETLKHSEYEMVCETRAHPKREPYSPSGSPEQIPCPEFVHTVVKKEITKETPLEGEIRMESSIVLKEEVKREPSP